MLFTYFYYNNLYFNDYSLPNFCFPIRAEKINEAASKNARFVLVGNKADMTEQRAISTEEAGELATSLGFRYFETSAKSDTNVLQTFEYLEDEILKIRRNQNNLNPT